MPEKTNTIDIVPQTNASTLVYKYGIRLNLESIEWVDEQIRLSRQLYNQIIEKMREIHQEMQSFTIAQAGPEGQALQDMIEQLNLTFNAAKANNDEPAMKQIAQERREHWAKLSVILKRVRHEHRDTLIERFYSRIGRNATCATYQCRAEFVQNGLGQSTATRILENALRAWQMSMKKGKAPTFSKASEKQQDQLTIQFSTAGGCPIETIFAGKRKDFLIQYPKEKGFAPRSYTPFIFRLGAASAHCYARGTVQVHRPIPANTHISMVHLVRKRLGNRFFYELHLVAHLSEPITIAPAHRRKPLVALHFGWSVDEQGGRRLAGWSDNGQESDVKILRLPVSIETDLQASEALQSKRDVYRDEIFNQLKAWNKEGHQDNLPTEGESDLARYWNKIRKLPAQHVSANALHRIVNAMVYENWSIPSWLSTWDKVDQRMWVQAVHLARRARNRRKNYYEQVALDLVRNYETIFLDLPDLKESAQKVNPLTGETTALTPSARSGRVVAALFVLDAAIKWAACKHGCAVLKNDSGKTAGMCHVCGHTDLKTEAKDSQTLYCPNCKSTLDRKRNGAVNAWRIVQTDLESLVTRYWEETRAIINGKADKDQIKKDKMAEGRREKRQARLQVKTT